MRDKTENSRQVLIKHGYNKFKPFHLVKGATKSCKIVKTLALKNSPPNKNVLAIKGRVGQCLFY